MQQAFKVDEDLKIPPISLQYKRSHLLFLDIRPILKGSGVCQGRRHQVFRGPYPLVTDLQHLGEEEQQQVGPGLSVAL